MLNTEKDINILVLTVIKLYQIVAILPKIMAVLSEEFVYFELSHNFPMF
jgi:hypothetical protein